MNTSVEKGRVNGIFSLGNARERNTRTMSNLKSVTKKTLVVAIAAAIAITPATRIATADVNTAVTPPPVEVKKVQIQAGVTDMLFGGLDARDEYGREWQIAPLGKLGPTDEAGLTTSVNYPIVGVRPAVQIPAGETDMLFGGLDARDEYGREWRIALFGKLGPTDEEGMATSVDYATVSVEPSVQIPAGVTDMLFGGLDARDEYGHEWQIAPLGKLGATDREGLAS